MKCQALREYKKGTKLFLLARLLDFHCTGEIGHFRSSNPSKEEFVPFVMLDVARKQASKREGKLAGPSLLDVLWEISPLP